MKNLSQDHSNHTNRVGEITSLFLQSGENSNKLVKPSNYRYTYYTTINIKLVYKPI